MSDSLSHRPGAVLSAASITSALVVTGILAGAGLATTGAGVLGVVGLTVGLTRSARSLVGLGVGGLAIGSVVGARAGFGVEALLVAIAGTFLAWEFATAALTTRDELEDGVVAYAEVTHVAATVLVTAGVAVLALVVFRSLTVGSSLPGATLLLVAATALGFGLRE